MVQIESCIQRLALPISEAGVTCSCDSYIQLWSNDTIERQIYFPYPEPGAWYIAFMARCYSTDGYVSRIMQSKLVSYSNVSILFYFYDAH